MVSKHLIPPDIGGLYEVHEWRNACAVLSSAHPGEWKDLIDVMRHFRLLKSDIVAPGGRKSQIASKIDQAFYDRGWEERAFDTTIRVDEDEYPSPTHKVDCFKGRVALEVEWNNKDPFYDRDLNNFRLLFDLRVIEAGVIVTRGDELQAVFDELGKGKSYGSSTTHMSRLVRRVEGGGGGGCPVLVFGIGKALYEEDK